LTLLTALRGDLSNQKADLIIHFQFEGESVPSTVSDSSLRSTLASVLKLDGFEGKTDTAVLWHSNGKHPASRYLVVARLCRGGFPGNDADRPNHGNGPVSWRVASIP
jgi:hypothetical protein